jgi:ankyrin repeat protein
VIEGADAGFVGALGESPLNECIKHNSIKIAELILRNGADPNSQFAGIPMLLQAVYHRRPEIVKILVGARADVNAVSNGITSLIRAVKNGDLATVRNLLEGGADPNLAGLDGFPPLHWALKGDSKEIEKLLRRHGATVSKELVSAEKLFDAIENGDLNTLRSVAMSGIYLEARDSLTTGRHTPLIAAIKTKRYEATRILVESGGDVNAPNIAGATPLMLAAQAGDTKTVNLLLQHGAAIEKKDNDGAGALAFSVLNNKPAVVRLLLKNGAPPSQKDKTGETPLHIASLLGRLPIVEALLVAGANVDAKDRGGNTPLMMGIARPKVVSKLLGFGADVWIRNKQRKTALDLAREAKNCKVAVKLLSKVFDTKRNRHV